MKKIIYIIFLGILLSCTNKNDCTEVTAKIMAEYQVYLDRNANSNATEAAKAKQREELIKERDKKIAEACN
jgi:hypothetical protein